MNTLAGSWKSRTSWSPAFPRWRWLIGVARAGPLSRNAAETRRPPRTRHIDELRDKNVDAIADTIALAKNMTEPLIVHVDDDNDGTQVQVFIG